MFINLFIFLLIVSILAAKLEIHIEGQHGWAKNLPTWRVKNGFTKLFWGELPLTGYHLYLMGTIMAFLHFPFFFGVEWSLSKELIIIAMFFFFFLMEDFFWFVLNPHFGLKKFSKSHIEWHHNWFFKIPTAYYKFILAGSTAFLLSLIV